MGSRIRLVRISCNLTQEKLGEMAGVDRQSINRIEGGLASPRLDTLLRIAEALRVPAAAFFVDS
ncbi:helix-turn-helix transcriptional regulator [Streptomyces olivoreticuli]